MSGFDTDIEELFAIYPQLQILQQNFNKQKTEAWLVGGTLRDLLLQRSVTDIDIATQGDPTSIAKIWAKEIGGRWFWLDAERCQSRVLSANQLTVDFTPLRAETIEADLALRDFTINALALPLKGDLNLSQVLDPLAGQADLQQKTLRFCSPRSFTDDPLRMIKGIRHAVSLNLSVEEKTFQQIGEHAALINSVAGERVRDELGKILSAENPVEGFRLLLSSGLLAELFGPCDANFSSENTLVALNQLDQSIKELELNSEPEEGAVDPFNSRALFLLATFLRDYAPENLSELLHSKLRLSRQQERILLSLQDGPGSQWFELTDIVDCARQKALLVEQLGYFPDEQLLYWTVFQSKITLEKARDLLKSFYQHQHLGRVPDLLNGHQLRELLPGVPDKELGYWQNRIKWAELIGEIADQHAALCWLEKEISN